ncbi:hypothetical protein SESBI_06714 [Sesbania bispinosa]|nr:hypothetical protein SESBI_06714 [Sesbania bispinosa]
MDPKSLDTTRSSVNVSINRLIDSCLLMDCEEGQDHVKKMHKVVHDVVESHDHEGCAIMVNVAKDLEAKAKESFAVSSSWFEKIYRLPDQLYAPELENCYYKLMKTLNYQMLKVKALEESWHTRRYGLEVQRPVIPPLSGAGSVRCSVKPASRGALRLGTMRPQPSLKSHGSTLNLERAGQHGAATSPTKRSQSHVPSPWCPHLGHKLALLNSAC